MNFGTLIRLLWRRRWLILLQVVLTAGTAFAFSAMQLPVYEASVRVFVMANSPSVQAQDMSELRGSYATYLDSSLRAQQVVDELQLDLEPSQLLADVEITAHPSDPTVEIVVQNSHPDLAAALAQGLAEQLVDYRRVANRELPAGEWVEAEQLEAPEVQLVAPQTAVQTIAGALFGLLAGAILVLLLDWMESGIIRNESDVERALAIPVVGSVPAAGSAEPDQKR